MNRAQLLQSNLDARFKLYAPHRIFETISEWVAFAKIGNDWRFVALDNDLTDLVTIGPAYSTRKALKADMARYIRESGY